MMKKHLVIGLGEVGKAIQAILKCDGLDKHKKLKDEYEFIHICFPYNALFKFQVEEYRKQYNAKYVVIHSTVPVGTSKALRAIHSPVRGVHPNLEEGIRTFIKYFGGDNAWIAAEEFQKEGIKTEYIINSDNTEALKLWDTTQYGLMIMIEKEIFSYCLTHGLDFDIVYKNANRAYNDGYQTLGKSEVVRPFLSHMPGKIGGHCVIPNAHLVDSSLAQLLIKKNAEY